MLTQKAGLFCLCCFWQAVRRLWSLHMSEIHRQAALHSSSNGYPTSWFILSVLFLTGGETSVVPIYTCLGSPITWIYNLVGTSTGPAGSFSLCLFWQAVRCHTDLHPGRNIYLTSWFIVSVLISVSPHGCLWSLQLSRIPHHTHLYPGRNLYLSSWFILSMLFLTGGEKSVVPQCVRDPQLHRSLPQ